MKRDGIYWYINVHAMCLVHAGQNSHMMGSSLVTIILCAYIKWHYQIYLMNMADIYMLGCETA